MGHVGPDDADAVEAAAVETFHRLSGLHYTLGQGIKLQVIVSDCCQLAAVMPEVSRCRFDCLGIDVGLRNEKSC